MQRDVRGVLLCSIAAAGYSTTAVLTKLAYRADVNITTLLSLRYIVASFGFWGIWVLLGTAVPSRQHALRGFLLGFGLASIQVWLLASALAAIDAALVMMLFYTYPAMILLITTALGREQPNRWSVMALGLSFIGIVLTLSTSGVEMAGFSSGMLLALGAAATFAVGLIVGHTLLQSVPWSSLSAMTTSGSTVAFFTSGVATGGLKLDFPVWGWLPIVGLALVSTVLATGTSYASMTRLGPTRAGIIMTLELPLSVILAVVLLHESLLPVQILGGILILAAIVLLQWRSDERDPQPGHSLEPSPAADG